MNSNTPKSIADIMAAYDLEHEFLALCNREDLLIPGRPGERTFFLLRDEIRLRLILKGRVLGFSFAELREILKATSRAPSPR